MVKCGQVGRGICYCGEVICLWKSVDAVWVDYNSDLAFTNRIVVQPFADGTFRYLSNAIEEKEREVPKVTE